MPLQAPRPGVNDRPPLPVKKGYAQHRGSTLPPAVRHRLGWSSVPHSLAREPDVSLPRGNVAAWPLVAETALVVVAVALLLPWFDRVAADDAGRDRRFAEAIVTVRGLPNPVLPVALRVLRRAGRAARARAALPPQSNSRPPRTSPGCPPRSPMPARRVRTAFLAPLNETQARLADLRLQQREGLGDLLVLSNAIEATEAELQPFVNRYVLDGPEGTGPAPLECAFEKVEASLARNAPSTASSPHETARANALLLLGAAIDGHPATPALADIALLPVESARDKGRCGAIRLPDALAQASVLMADARQAPTTSSKNDAMRALLRYGGLAMGGLDAGGLRLASACRADRSRRRSALRSRSATWAFAAWIGRVPWPLAAERAFVPGRVDAWWFTMPAPFVLWLVACAAVVLVSSGWLSKRLPAGPETMASRIGYPGLVVCHRHRLAAAARPVGQRAHRQSLSRALSPGPSLARHADLERARVPAPAHRTGARMVPVGARRSDERDRLARSSRRAAAAVSVVAAAA